MIQIESLPEDIRPAFQKLCRILESCGSLVVAYSGGVDSGFLSYVARDVLGDAMISVLGISTSFPGREEAEAIEFLELHGIPYDRIRTEELSVLGYRANGPDRCYYCKGELFTKLEAYAGERGFERIAHGANVDDQLDHRPGNLAAREKSVVAPLVEAGFTKEKIRRAAEALNLSLWDKPAAPCLASRVPYYSPVTAEKLKQIEDAECALKDLGFITCRVRHHGDVARIEVPAEDRTKLFEEDTWRTIVERIKRAGFQFVAVDMEGFRSGRLNEALKKHSS